MRQRDTKASGDESDPPEMRRPRPGALLRYTVFQIPELGVVATLLVLAVRSDWLSQTSACFVFAAWLAKDVLLFRLVRDAYGPGDGRLPRDPRGQIGIAPDGLEEEGYVRLGPERWRSRRAGRSGPIAPGDRVRVVALHGLTLEVEACPTSAADEAARDSGS